MQELMARCNRDIYPLTMTGYSKDDVRNFARLLYTIKPESSVDNTTGYLDRFHREFSESD